MVFVDKELAIRLETAEADLTRQYVDAYYALYRDAGAGSVEVCGGRVSFAGRSSPLSKADAVGLVGEVKAADLDFIEDYLVIRGARPTLVACPFTDRSLFSLAGQRGYEIDQFLNLYILPLPHNDGAQAQSAQGAPTQASPVEDGGHPAREPGKIGVKALPTGDRETYRDTWSVVVGLGFASMDAGSPPYMDIYRSIAHASGTISFLATVGGEPAGAGALKITGNTAFLSTASTLPQYRRQGVQMALMKARLAEAVRQGCDLAVVMTSPGADSERNVVRAGFRLAYTRIRLVKR